MVPGASMGCVSAKVMTAYYNEIEPYCAQWLRNLIGAGLIAPGEVDERSIVDVRGDDLRSFTQCHFFAGIAGWSYALRLAGWEDDRPVWTGSCPCQPLSSAGQRKGHADERHLWPAFHRLIAERRPATVFGEQVASKDGREWLAGVRADLEVLGYACGAADLCAAGVSAPHIRQRLFWMADSMCNGWEMRRNIHGTHDKTQKQFKRGALAGTRSKAVEYDGICEPPIQLLPHAVPNAMAELRAYGNAIVAPLAAEFIGSFMECQP